MLLLHDPRCAEYGSYGHPEQPARVTKTAAHLRASRPSWAWRTAAEGVPDETLLLAHTPAHLARLEVPRDFDPDTAYFPGIALHARRSVAAALAATGHALASREPAFALMRPPGHHATADRAMGFCYLNQVAIAALAARRDLGARRVAVWDFDAHHCNGTEAILFGREEFLVCSVHQAPGYPGTGLRDCDNSRNWALPPQTPRDRHLQALRASLDAIVSFRPDLVLVSAGFDAYARDPITEMALETEDFAQLGRWLLETGLSAAAILEGGYSPDLPTLVEAFLAAWAA
ncbi:MAG TPA: histone deacetylase [Opitutaceae bacterium]|nr:histone deacetylase [Opitutaceae bacterium]